VAVVVEEETGLEVGRKTAGTVAEVGVVVGAEEAEDLRQIDTALQNGQPIVITNKTHGLCLPLRSLSLVRQGSLHTTTHSRKANISKPTHQRT